MEIIINGEITDQTANTFSNLDGSVTVRINSHGGDIAAALAIYNRLKSHSDVSIVVEGLCASAATVIACAGHCRAFENALFMIHSPLACLNDGFYQADDLSKTIEVLTAFEGSIIDIYRAKTGLDSDTLRTMLADETWLTADDAKALGFVDEIIPERATVENKGGVTYINRIAASEKHFKKKGELTRMNDITNETLLEKIKGLFDGKEVQALTTERDRLKDALARSEIVVANLKDELRNTRSELEERVARLEREKKTLDDIYALIEGNVKSGAANVRASTTEALDVRTQNINRVVSFANRKGGSTNE